MRILFDNGVPKKLRRSLPGHHIKTTAECGWETLVNGELLCVAQDEFEVLLSTDSNMKYQQRLPDYDIALIVLRAFNTKLESYLPLVPEVENILTTIQPGEVVYIYADQKLALKDQQKGRK
jgi:predicted nuclease of predicted toxin-antitoxin system